MSAREVRRDRILELRVQERDLVQAIDSLTEQLKANRAEQAQQNALLLKEAKRELRGPPVVTSSAGRSTLAKLRVFTIGNATARLGWKRADVKKLVEVMLCEQPPSLEDVGPFEGSRAYRYIGPPIAHDPVAEQSAVEFEKMKEWALSKSVAFTPGECGAACGVTRAVALRALLHLAQLGVLVDDSPTADMPIFVVPDKEAPDVPSPPALQIVPPPQERVFSRVPEIQQMLAAAHAAGLEVTETGKTFAIEGPTGRVLIPSLPQGRKEMLDARASIRRMGAKL